MNGKKKSNKRRTKKWDEEEFGFPDDIVILCRVRLRGNRGLRGKKKSGEGECALC